MINPNTYEIAALIIAQLLVLGYARWAFRSWAMALLLMLLVLPSLLFSVERVSQFLTTDELFVTHSDVTDLDGDPLDQWMHSALRTTITLQGPLAVTLYDNFPDLDYNQHHLGMMKVVHWLLSFITILWMYHVLSQHFVPASSRLLFFVLFFSAVFLLPISNLAFKVFNYDALSMTLGILAMLYIITALKTRNRRDALMAVIAGMLASQEKLSASPVLVLAIALYGALPLLISGGTSSTENDQNQATQPVVHARKKKKKRSPAANTLPTTNESPSFVKRALSIWMHLVPAMVVALLVSGGSTIFVAWFRNWNIPDHFLIGMMDPLISWTWVILRFSFGMTEFRDFGLTIAMLLITLGACYLLGVAILLIDQTLATHRSWLLRLPRQLTFGNSVGALLVLAIGILSTYLITAYWGPYHPPRHPDIRPPGELNGIFVHFDAETYTEHMLSYVGFAYAVFVNAIPTAYWLILIGVTVLMFVFDREQPIELGLEVLMAGALLLPLPLALIQIPVHDPRYMNIGILLFALMVLLKGVHAMHRFSFPKQSIIVGATILLVFIEVFPFRPLYAAFRPIWAEYDDPHQPVIGKLNPSWLGWGEEVMLAGEMLQAQCAKSPDNTIAGASCDSLAIHASYPGWWMPPDSPIRIYLVTFEPLENLTLTNQDYYLINRSAVAQGVPFPVGIEPDFVISFRGFDQAWAFHGDRVTEYFNQPPPITTQP